MMYYNWKDVRSDFYMAVIGGVLFTLIAMAFGYAVLRNESPVSSLTYDPKVAAIIGGILSGSLGFIHALLTSLVQWSTHGLWLRLADFVAINVGFVLPAAIIFVSLCYLGY